MVQELVAALESVVTVVGVYGCLGTGAGEHTVAIRRGVGSVEGGSVVWVQVPSLIDVEFAVLRPVLADSPASNC